MGIFSNNNGKELRNLSSADSVNIIAPETYIKGVIEAAYMIQIEGVLEGDIKHRIWFILLKQERFQEI